MKKRKFTFKSPLGEVIWTFYAEDWHEVEEMLLECVEEDTEDLELTDDQKSALRADEMYGDYKETA